MGFFSWKTQDTNRSISNSYSTRGTFTVYMVNPLTMESYREDNYEGYGVFGGKDYYELLAEINNMGSDRDIGIDIEGNKGRLSPILVEDVNKAKDYIGQTPQNCQYQGYFYDDMFV